MVKTISKESKDLAIEFAEWCSNGDYYFETNLWVHTIFGTLHKPDELFDKFLEEKHNENIQDI